MPITGVAYFVTPSLTPDVVHAVGPQDNGDKRAWAQARA